MTTSPQPVSSAAQKQNRRKKTRAIMASGLVLGVGAAVTLAAWSDTVWGEGTFGTEGSAFNIQGSFDGGTTWAERVSPTGAGTNGAAAGADPNGPGAMAFAQNANSLIPGQPVYQLVGLHETEGNLGADIVLTRTNADESGLADLVTVAVADAGTGAAAPACGANADLAFNSSATIGAAPGEMLTTEVEAGNYRWVCFSATLSSDATVTDGDLTSTPILWQFAATSQDPA